MSARRGEREPSRAPAPATRARGARRERGTGRMMTRVATLRSTTEYLRRVLAPGELASVLAALSPAERALVERAPATDEVPYAIELRLWRAADAALGARDPRWMERVGAFAIERAAEQVGDVFLRRRSPLAFLTQQVPLFRLYYRPGDMVLLEHGPGRAAVRLVGFDPGDALFCRRFTGGWTTALEISGGRDVAIRHLRCTCEGDLFCEWSLRWAE